MKLNRQQNVKYGQILPFLQSGDSLYHKGLMAYKKQDLKKAIYYLERAVKMKKDDPVFYCQLAAIYTESGEYERSNELLNHVIESIDKEMYECYFFLANNYAYLGYFEKAQEMAFHYLENSSDGEFIQDCKALISIMQYEDDELEEWSEEIADEEILIIRHDHAYSYLEQGNYDMAIEQFEKMIKENPTLWSAYNHIAEALFAQGKTEEAIQVIDDVLQKDKGNLISLCHLAFFYHQLQRFDESARIINSIKQVKPLDFDQRFKLAETLCKVEQYESAYSHLIALKKNLFTGEEKFYQCIAVAAYHCGAIEKAVLYWQRLDKLGDTNAKHMLNLYHDQLLTREHVRYLSL